MDDKINVLHIRNCRGITTLTGPETYLIDLINGFKGNGCKMHLAVSYDPINPSHFFFNELKKHSISFYSIPVYKAFLLNEFFYIRRIIKYHDINIIHSHDFRSDFIGLLLSKFFKIPLVCFAHGWVNWVNKYSKAWLYAFLEARIISLASKIIVASRYMLSNSEVKSINPHKINFIPIGIDLDKYETLDSRNIRKEFKIDNTSFLVGSIGRIHPWKGQRYLIEAARIVCNRLPETIFLIVGDIAYPAHQPFKDTLFQLVRSLDLEKNIIFTGSRTDISQILPSFDLFVLPSIREPFGLVLLEAQASEVPIIATRVGGIPEVIEENVTGNLISPKNSIELSSAIIELLNDPPKRKYLGQNGRLRVAKNFALDSMVEQTRQLYLSVS